MIELQDIFTRHAGEYLASHQPVPVQLKAIADIINCRTSVLGAHIDCCDECGFEKISYNSCRNRHCPKCQAFAKEDWLERQNRNLLECPYFHVVFTVPQELNPVFYQNQRRMYALLFKAASETILELCADRKYLGAKPGITAVLHTWGQNLSYHPHLHCVVSGGGLTEFNSWKNSRNKFFIPIKVLSKKFRGKFLHCLHMEHLRFYGDTARLGNPHEFDSLVAALYKTDWITYCKPPFGGPQKVMDYLGRYTHRVAISNNRIMGELNGRVSFKWRDYADGNQQKIMTLSADEFIRRFLLHILPSGFRKIRHFGIFASRNKTGRLALCRRLTNTRFLFAPEAPVQRLNRIFGPDWNLCPKCKSGHLSRASPLGATA